MHFLRLITGTIAVSLSLSLTAAAAAPSSGQNEMTVQVAAKEIVVSGVSPGSDVYLFGGLQVGHVYYTTLKRVDLTATDDDHDGVVRFPYAEGVPFRSVWIAIDQRNGKLGAGTPAGYPLRISEIPANAWKRKSGNAIDSLALRHNDVEFLFVHPGQGVWRFQAYQGGKLDDDGVDDGTLTVLAARMAPAKKGGPKAPSAFGGGDVVVAIDLSTLEVLASKVPQ